MLRGSPLLRPITVQSTDFTPVNPRNTTTTTTNHKRKRTPSSSAATSSFRPPPRLTTTLPRLLPSCPSSYAIHDTFVVQIKNILRQKNNAFVQDELWVQYVVVHSTTKERPSTAVSGDDANNKDNNTATDNDGTWVIGTILDPATRFWNAVRNHAANTYTADVVVDGHGSIVTAGFIDLQLNGAFGVDFTSSELTEAQVHTVARGVLAHGVTSFLPTIITSAKDTYAHAIPTIARAVKNPTTHGSHVLGLHLEGPFIHPMKKGAHPINHITSPNEGMKTIRQVYGHLEMVRVVTLAPELPGSFSAISGLTTMGVRVLLCGVAAATACILYGCV